MVLAVSDMIVPFGSYDAPHDGRQRLAIRPAAALV
jgi:hypothetical protein